MSTTETNPQSTPTGTPGAVQPTIARLDPDPFTDWYGAGYANVDANVMFVDGDHLVGFHVTTPEGAEAILRDGPTASPPTSIGFDGRLMPEGFWLNNVPFIPYSVEQWMPRFLFDTDMAALAVSVPRSYATKPLLDTTWPFLQWPVAVEDIVSIVPVSPEAFVALRSEAALADLAHFIKESVEEGLMPSDGYAAAVGRLAGFAEGIQFGGRRHD